MDSIDRSDSSIYVTAVVLRACREFFEEIISSKTSNGMAASRIFTMFDYKIALVGKRNNVRELLGFEVC